jgi:hypothetical protein
MSRRHASVLCALACTGLALTMTAGSAQAQVQIPQSYALYPQTGALTSEQVGEIRSVLQGKQKTLVSLPTEINPNVLSVTGTSPGPATVSNSGSPPTIATPGLAAAAASVGIKAPTVARGVENYGNLYGVNSPYHYNDILIDGSEYYDFPQSATTMMWITSDGGASWGWCSASLIGRNIGVAAGHCVRENHTWINGGIIIPDCIGCGRFDANISAVFAPYGYAWVYWVETTSGWYNNEGIDQGYDISVFVTGPRIGTNNYLGDYTGWNSFCYLYCLQPDWALRQTGFPFDYDGGNWMYEGQHLDVSDGRDYVEGSGAGPGSSGGPWVANAGLYPAYLFDSSADKGQWPNGNVTFATTSWGYNCGNNASCSYKIQGGSSLSGVNNSNDGRGTGFKGMYNDACTESKALFGAALCNLL